MRGDGEKGEAEGARRRERGKRVLRGRWQGEGNLAVVGQVIEIQQQVSELSGTLKATRKEKQDHTLESQIIPYNHRSYAGMTDHTLE